ncbi:MAG: hypothetical protein QMD97_03275 [Candidatus Aenigmarchaeota archaeon]|nr:hypothetical protein [Candidatus Aenigmarchaeota archaeon]
MEEEPELTCNICGKRMKMRRVRLFGRWEDMPECPQCKSHVE